MGVSSRSTLEGDSWGESKSLPFFWLPVGPVKGPWAGDGRWKQSEGRVFIPTLLPARHQGCPAEGHGLSPHIPVWGRGLLPPCIPSGVEWEGLPAAAQVPCTILYCFVNIHCSTPFCYPDCAICFLRDPDRHTEYNRIRWGKGKISHVCTGTQNGLEATTKLSVDE